MEILLGVQDMESQQRAAGKLPGHRCRMALKASTRISSFFSRFVVPSMAANALAMTR